MDCIKILRANVALENTAAARCAALAAADRTGMSIHVCAYYVYVSVLCKGTRTATHTMYTQVRLLFVPGLRPNASENAARLHHTDEHIPVLRLVQAPV